MVKPGGLLEMGHPERHGAAAVVKKSRYSQWESLPMASHAGPARYTAAKGRSCRLKVSSVRWPGRSRVGGSVVLTRVSDRGFRREGLDRTTSGPTIPRWSR
ncbi:hypothetical protein LIA77_05261 [Sarocladium implicatum]|nr:hypothetical protein LIA77_05261 [Sarocladium implicatum]